MSGVDKTGGKAPEGYTTIKLYNTKTKKVDAQYYIPVGHKISFNGKTYDPSKTANNEFVIKGETGESGYEMMGLALRSMDTNNKGKGDGFIDDKDNNADLAPKINKDSKLPKGVKVDYLDPTTSDAFVNQGTGYVKFTKGGHMGREAYYVEITDSNGEIKEPKNP